MMTQTDLGVSDRVQGPGYINVRRPADGRVVGKVPDMTPGQVHDVARQQELRGVKYVASCGHRLS
jgi:hypothetical protein